MSARSTFVRRGVTAAAAAAGASILLLPLVATPGSSQTAPAVRQAQTMAAIGGACHITQTKSGASPVTTSVRFVNHHSGTVGLYWLNYQGYLVFYKSIVHRGSFVQVTYRKNAWVVLSSSFNCVGYFIANGARQYVIK